MKKTIIAIIAAVVIALVAAWALDIDVSGDVEMPEVSADVEMTEGEMPEVDVRTVDIDVEERQGSVPVPTDVNVETEEKTFEYPALDVEKPEENTTAEEDDLEME